MIYVLFIFLYFNQYQSNHVIASPMSNRTNELPTQVLAYLLPDLILCIEFVAIFEQGEAM
jgi:hypothetical protein